METDPDAGAGTGKEVDAGVDGAGGKGGGTVTGSHTPDASGVADEAAKPPGDGATAGTATSADASESAEGTKGSEATGSNGKGARPTASTAALPPPRCLEDHTLDPNTHPLRYGP